MNLPIHDRVARAVHTLEREGTDAWQHLTHQHQPAQEARMPTSLSDAIHNEVMTAVDRAVTDVIGRYLNDPHNLLSALADVIDGHAMQPPAPPVQPGDADAPETVPAAS